MLRRKAAVDHIPRLPAEDMSDDEIDNAILSMKNASDVLPRKTYLRQERVSRTIAAIGMHETEVRLGIIAKTGELSEDDSGMHVNRVNS